MAWTLCSKNDVVAIHPIAEAELQDGWSEMVEALIRQYMGQPHLGTSQAIVDEWYDGDGSDILRVRKPYILSVQFLSVSGVLLSADDYVAFESYIQLKTGVFPRGNLNIKLSYTSGSLVNDVVRLAATTMIVAIVNYRKRAGADASLKWGTADQKAGEQTPNLNVGLTSHLVRIMKQILRRPTLRAR